MATAAAPNEDALRDALKTQDGIKNLGRLTGTRTIKRSMDREERTLEAQENALHQELHGGESPGGAMPHPSKEGEPMEIMIGNGDVILNQPPPATPTPESPAKKPAGTLAKAALVAALLGGGGGLGVGIPWLMGMFDKPTIEQPTEPTDPNAYGLSL